MRECAKQLTLFTEASPADVSHSAWQASRKGGTTTDIYGRSFCGWSERLDRVGLSLKTYLALSTSRLMRFAPVWSVKATQSGYGIMKLWLSAHRTEGSGYFLWRTPDAHCDRGFRKRETFERRMERGMPIQLNDQVAHIAQTPIKGGSLNPEWVEWLMGLPIGWAEV